jgi:ubiquinone/menaquinone biosynthesis C-methylase UbiE
MNESCCSCGPNSTNNVEEAVKKFYGQIWAGQKEGKLKEPQESADPGQIAHEALLRELAPKKGMRVLDIGSGPGETVLAIAEKVGPTGKVAGVDLTPEGIALSREKAKQRKLQNVAEFHQTNALELPFPNDSFDAVISECVVCLIQDKQKSLNEKVRVLKPGGRVIMHDVVNWMPMPRVMRENSKLYCECVGGAVSIDEYVGMMKKAGLTDIKTVDFTKYVKKIINADSFTDLKDDEFQEIVNFVRKGGIGYALLTGTKRSS